MRATLAIVTCAIVSLHGGAAASAGPCPTERALIRALGLRAGQSLDGDVNCARGRGLTVVGVRIGDGSDFGAGGYTVAGIDDRGRLLFRRELPEYADPTGVYESHSIERLADLDGDGRDEILLRATTTNPMSSGDSLVVLQRRGRTLRQLLERDLGSKRLATFGGRGEHDYRPLTPAQRLECKAEIALEPRGRGSDLVIRRAVIAGAKAGAGDRSGSCAPAVEIYRYRRGELERR